MIVQSVSPERGNENLLQTQTSKNLNTPGNRDSDSRYFSLQVACSECGVYIATFNKPWLGVVTAIVLPFNSLIGGENKSISRPLDSYNF